MLVPQITLGSLDLTSPPFAVEFGRDMGAPENVTDDLVTMLTDGEIVSSSRSANRQIVLPLLIEGADMIELAEAEASLLAEADKQQNELTVDPGDGFGAPTVYDTFRAQVEFAYDDDGEVAGLRRYLLTMPALPFGRSPWPVTTDAVSSAATPSTVTINDGSATTGWSSSDGTAPTSDGSAVSLVIPFEAYTASGYDDVYAGTAQHWQTVERWLRLSGSFDFTSTRYLVVDFSANGGYPRAKADGVELTPLSVSYSPAFPYPYRRAVFLAPNSTVALLEFISSYLVDSSTQPADTSFKVTNLTRTNQAPSSTTLYEKPLRLPIIGSARAIGSLAISHPTSGLGEVIVHTCTDVGDGYTPPTSPWRTSTTTPSSAAVAGKYSTDAYVATIPLAMLRPGPYEVIVRANRASGGLTPKVTATLSTSSLSASAKVTYAALNTWYIHNIGVLTVGDHPATTAATATLTVTGANLYDEVWLFYAGDDASRTQIAAGSNKRVWLDTPSLANPKRSVWVGSNADRTDAVSGVSLLTAWGRHDLDPAGTLQFVVTTGALDAVTQATYYPTFHTHNAYRPS